MSEKETRWGHLNEIDYRCKVGSEAWKRRHPRRIQHLSAYRRLHELAEHDQVRELADVPVSKKLNAIRKLESDS